MIAQHWRRFWAWKNESQRNTGIFWTAVVVVDVLLGFLIAQLLVSDISAPGQKSAVARLEPVQSVEVVLDRKAKPAALEQPRGMATQKAGLGLFAVGNVDKVTIEKKVQRAREGSRLVAFRVGDWACETKPCEKWTSLKPQVIIDGITKDLPAGGDTFVVVVPPGVEAVELTIAADGYEQSLSLLDESDGDQNIVFLEDRERGERLKLNERFQVGERTSTQVDAGLGAPTDTLTRDITVEYAERRFFLNGETPSTPRRVFLVVNAYYAYVGNPKFYGFSLSEVSFVDGDGKSYPARDLDPAEDRSLLGFEIPATVREGEFVVGGMHDLVSPNGSTYTSSLGDHTLPLSFD